MREIPFEIPGFRIGHAQNREAATGCTVVLCEDGAVAGVDVRGGSPGTRETDALDPRCLREKTHAVLLAGGSAFGLDAAAGVMQYLEEKGIGRDVAVARVPAVCAAILFDLKCGDGRVRPDKKMGYEACLCARPDETRQGNIGAGTGATVGKKKGPEFAMKGGLGVCCLNEGGLLAGAVMAVNCVGDVADPATEEILAGMLNNGKTKPGGTEKFILSHYTDQSDLFSGNTVIGAVMTNAVLTKPQAAKIASVSHDGIARTVRPSHSVFDGDTIFALSRGSVRASPDAVGILAVRAVTGAILSAVKNAEALAGFPAWRDFTR